MRETGPSISLLTAHAVVRSPEPPGKRERVRRDHLAAPASPSSPRPPLPRFLD
jgi:hypothetical protein